MAAELRYAVRGARSAMVLKGASVLLPPIAAQGRMDPYGRIWR